MFTIFDFFGLLLPIVGLVVGATRGFERAGVLGGVVGAALGGVIGIVAARLALIVPLALISWRLGRRSTADLQSELRGKKSLAPNVLLMELKRRGEAAVARLRQERKAAP
jgi:hypothetical protein